MDVGFAERVAVGLVVGFSAGSAAAYLLFAAGAGITAIRSVCVCSVINNHICVFIGSNGMHTVHDVNNMLEEE